jgi:hypothetical protein
MFLMTTACDPLTATLSNVIPRIELSKSPVIPQRHVDNTLPFRAFPGQERGFLLLKNKDQSVNEQCASHAALNCVRYLGY